MKKFFVAACLLMCALTLGCGSDADQGNERINIGTITNLNISEQRVNNVLNSIMIKLPAHNFVYYDNLSAMLMALDGENINEISTYKSVADYLVTRRPDLQYLYEHKFDVKLEDRFCCAVKSEDATLIGEINAAIKSMKSDGTLESLTKKYIVELDAGSEPEAIAMTTIDNASTIRVAVTGDFPPFDLIRADGTPAGFNTAVLSEIGKRMNRNIELVSVESSARASALSADNVDVIFWVRVPNDYDAFPSNFDCPEGIALTDYYFQDEIVHVGKK